jgi:hypothetical protein
MTSDSPYPGAREPTQGQTTASPIARPRRGGGEAVMVPPAEPRSYYGRAVIAEPVWSPEIPLYFWVGGLSGASAPVALLASLTGNGPLARRAAATTLAGSALSAALLVKDLGQPKRFLYMLRVFKPTSPMSVGSWTLTAFGASAALSAARELLGMFPRTGRAAQVAGGVLGPVLSTYTAALLAQTAVPVWHDARRELPFVFASSSLATGGALGVVLAPVPAAAPARRMAVAGAALELATSQLMEGRLGDIAEPYRSGAPGLLSRGAKAATAIGAVTTAVAAGRDRRAAIAGGVAILAGGLLERWAIFRAGFVSARDPKYTVGPQRARLAERDGRPTPYVRERG